MARYTAVLLGGGANAHGRVLRPETLATMFQPHYQPDPRIPGMGLGFFRSYAGDHQTAYAVTFGVLAVAIRVTSAISVMLPGSGG
jgi:hypothetical protein